MYSAATPIPWTGITGHTTAKHLGSAGQGSGTHQDARPSEAGISAHGRRCRLDLSVPLLTPLLAAEPERYQQTLGVSI
jgi:hypothetical protein